MATRFQTTNLTGTGVQIGLPDGENLVIAAGVLVGSADDDSVQGSGQTHNVVVLGSVWGDADGIQLGKDRPIEGSLVARVMASGTVSGGAAGVRITGVEGTVINDGAISGAGSGILFSTIRTDTEAHVVNRGVISGSQGITSKIAGLDVTNFGTIESSSQTGYAIVGSFTQDLIVNRGVLIGNVSLADSADTYDGRGGRVEGVVLGGAGNDTFFAGDAVDRFNGGAGVDTLDFRGSAGLRVSLADGSHTGIAEGDEYTSIEVVMGSRGGGDELIGDAAVNSLYGFGGSDMLSGRGGNDILQGGVGADILTGGAGNDSFRYRAPEEGGDVITDFGRVAGNNDRFVIVAEEFGGGLVPGPLDPSQFESRADNHAQDPDVRFIFRTTDQTLWFDVNGSDAGGLSLIADLQSGAIVTSQDILLV